MGKVGNGVCPRTVIPSPAHQDPVRALLILRIRRPMLPTSTRAKGICSLNSLKATQKKNREIEIGFDWSLRLSAAAWKTGRAFGQNFPFVFRSVRACSLPVRLLYLMECWPVSDLLDAHYALLLRCMQLDTALVHFLDNTVYTT